MSGLRNNGWATGRGGAEVDGGGGAWRGGAERGTCTARRPIKRRTTRGSNPLSRTSLKVVAGRRSAGRASEEEIWRRARSTPE
jgi:hypothetical protein